MNILLVILIFIFGFINLFALVVIVFDDDNFSELIKQLAFDEELNIAGKIIIFIACSPVIILVGVPLLICKGIVFVLTWHPKKHH